MAAALAVGFAVFPARSEPSPAASAAFDWTAAQPLRDLRHEGAEDWSEAVRAGGHLVALPAPLQLAGRRYDALLVGAGFLQPLALAERAARSADDSRTRLDVLEGPRLDVFAGDAVRLPRNGRVLGTAQDDSLVVRWTGLEGPSGGTAIVEALIDPSGVELQYLHLPQRSLGDLAAGLALAGVEGAPLRPASARAYGLVQRAPDPPSGSEPGATGPAPPDCPATVGTWCDTSTAACSGNAGRQGNTRCSERVASQWTFDEGDFCQDCPYTFYVLVECGREMHLPVADMEGMDLRISDVVSGRPVTLRCWNQTARADAGLGQYPTILFGDCDGNPGEEQWWGPAYDVTDSAGPGAVSWGFPGCPDLIGEYDTSGDNRIDCSEVPPGGGELDRLSPGEGQVMDCFIADPAGLCGLYRVDIGSGGFQWDLFANCDGSATPQFDIYFDCTEAWAAYEPLPELAVDDLVVTGTCPDVTVSFDVRNIGCTPHPGSVLVRIESNCAAPEVLDHVVTGPIPAGSAVPVTLPFPTSCAPVTVTVTLDPADAVVECTESSAAAACRAEQGIDSASVVACACGADVQAWVSGSCRGPSAAFSGSCGGGFVWWDLDVTIDSDGDTDPANDVDVPTCVFTYSYPAPGTYTARLWKLDQGGCTSYDDVTFELPIPRPIVPDATATPDCAGGPTPLDCGVSEPGVDYAWDVDIGTDTNGDGDPGNDVDAVGCALSWPYPPGVYSARVIASSDGVAGDCRSVDGVTFAVTDGSAVGEVTGLRLARARPSLTLTWAPEPASAAYRVVRGTLGAWYDHLADPAFPADIGACFLAATTLVDADDGDIDYTNRYYLVGGIGCGIASGPLGSSWDGHVFTPRPPPIDSASCP